MLVISVRGDQGIKVIIISKNDTLLFSHNMIDWLEIQRKLTKNLQCAPLWKKVQEQRGGGGREQEIEHALSYSVRNPPSVASKQRPMILSVCLGKSD